ncbi:YbaB/EbfC family nucleoid-associated protein [Actinomadura sp. DC4]|uniref:YbaB/EbfC family nucleoid-associated protein n=1 Tax=Actinomadura sp. DC4 TaxID=3055069 RepID=UPI0025AFFFFC|nr:YbaB/EbfC family nucleoid-associated protein [Actinomadura sp. DC4]MDN3354483.1 YbaB/EbfC family nucleoid-associated protein [Actinomadura sp. DC4]
MEPGGEPNIQQMLQQAQRMQEQLMNLQRELAETEVDGSSGGGLVTATVNGQSELVKLVIDPAAIDAADPQETAETIADLVLAAIHAAGEEAQRLQETKMGPLTEGLSGLGGGLPGGLGLPEL